MGRRGPAPTPTALRVLKGRTDHRPLPIGEPRPAPIMPRCPLWLDDEGKREWRKIAPKLFRLGLLTEVDGEALACYCQSLSMLRTATAVLHKRGQAFSTPSGYKQQRPEVAIAMKSMLLVRAFAAEFGMTPSARTRINVDRDDDDDVSGLLS